MKIFISAIYSYDSFARGIMPDVLQTQIDRHPEAEIYYLTNSHSFNICYFNLDKRPEHCYRCKTGIKNTLEEIQGPFQHLRISDLVSQEDINEAKRFFANVEKIDFHQQYESFEVGAATLSTYISRTRDRDLLNVEQDFVKELAENALALYLAAKRFIKREKIDVVYNFNGRHGYVRAVMKAAMANEIDCWNVERARLGGYLEYFKNVLPHNIAAKKAHIDANWNDPSVELEDKRRMAEDFFRRQRAGESVIFPSFLKGQQEDLLPEEVDKNQSNIVLFTSSDDEFAAMGEDFRNPIFESQLEGIEFLCDLFGKNILHKNLIIRMHPNLRGLHYPYVENIRKLNQKYPNIYVVFPESRIHSYSLIDISEKVLSFGSTIGMEATYYGKPSILLGKCFFYFSEVAYTPQTRLEIERLLSRDLEPMPKENTLRFGYYYVAGGVKADYYYERAIGEGIFFKGKRIHTYSLFQRVTSKLIEESYNFFGRRLKF